MAKYDRDFLVPYLQNICALHLATRQIDSTRNWLSQKWQIALDRRCPTPPKKGEYEYESGANQLARFLGVISLILFALMFAVDCLNGSEGGDAIFGGWAWFFLFLGVIGCCVSYTIKKQVDKQNEWVDSLYDFEWDSYWKKYEKAETDAENERKELDAELRVWSHERSKVQGLLQDLYSVNVLPNQYRNIYAAVYLYDYFSNSREDDLAMALNTLVLEQIKDKLDVVIENQAEIILNQCTIMSNQRLMISQQSEYAAMVESKLEQISSCNEERNQYLRMIETNTAAAAYFASAEYISSR